MGRGFDAMHGVSHYGGTFGPWIIGAMVVKLVILVAVIFIAYKVLKKHNFRSISAIKILNERYAKGEIEEEEYLKRKEILKAK